MSPDFPQELIDALSSPSICDNKTSFALEQLLVPNAPPQCSKNNIQEIRKKVPAGSALVKKNNKVVKPARKTAVAVLDENASRRDPLEQYALAVEVVNSVLKTLTLQARNKGTITETSSSCQMGSLHSSSPRNYLLDASPNRCTGFVGSSGPEKKKKACNGKENVREGIQEIAKCGILAFEFLGSERHKLQNGAAQSRKQLETGIYAFIGKVIDLGMKNIAFLELKKSHQRLKDLLFAGAREDVRKRKNRIDRENSPHDDNVAHLLAFEGVIDPKGEAVSSIVGHQLLVLKHLVAFPDATALVESIGYMRRSFLSSPLNLLSTELTQLHTKPLAAQKLEGLAKILLAIASSKYQVTEGTEACQAFSICCAVFEMQTLAQEARLLWMSSSAHCGNLDIEILRPFFKYFTIFSKSASMRMDSMFALANRMITNINTEIKRARHVNQNLLLKGPTDIELRLLLSSLAEKAGLYAEALDILDAAGETADQAFNETLSSTWSCRKAAILFKHHAHLKVVHDPLKTLIQAWEDLRNTSNGTVSQLRQVLEETNFLRSCITSYLKASGRPTDSSSCSPLSNDFKRTSILFMVECLRFVRRYATHSLPIELEKASQSQENACFLIMKLLQPCIESILHALLMVNGSEQESWMLHDESLQECLVLLEFVNKNYYHVLSTSIRFNSSMSLMRSRISSVYWNYHLVLRRNPLTANMVSVASSLQKSINILKICDSTEQIASALPYRIYKLATLSQSSSKGEDAENLFRDCIRTTIKLGALECLDPHYTHECAVTLWTSNERTRELMKFLNGFLALHSHNPLITQAFYDDCNLTYEQRGLLLEQQLWEISSKGTENMISCENLAAQLLHVSEGNPTSPQLVRAALHVLRLSNHTHGGISSATSLKAESIALELLQSRSQHEGLLSASVKHLYASLALHLTLRRHSVESGFLQEAIMFWRSLCEERKDEKQLKGVIGDLSIWTSSLKVLGSFLEIHGNTFLEIATLEILFQVWRRVEPQDHQYLVYLLCKLSIRCSQAGLTTKAGAYLTDVGLYLKQEDPSVRFQLEFNLASGEIALALGNYEKA